MRHRTCLVRISDVAMPAEHGGWSLTLEPALLGLIVAPSTAGFGLAGAALVAFLLRTPLKTSLVDHRRGRKLPRTSLAQRVAAVEATALLGLVLLAAVTAEASFWVPLVPAAPLVGIEMWFDIRSRSRRLTPELVGAVGIGSVAAAIALAGGRSGLDAAGLWIVVAARSVAAIPFVRVQLRRAKTQAHRLAHSDEAQLLAGVVVVAGLLVGAVPMAGAVSVGLLGVAHLALVRRTPPRAAILGAQQVVLGLSVVMATALGMLAP